MTSLNYRIQKQDCRLLQHRLNAIGDNVSIIHNLLQQVFKSKQHAPSNCNLRTTLLWKQRAKNFSARPYMYFSKESRKNDVAIITSVTHLILYTDVKMKKGVH